MRTRIISAFPGMGKTYYYNNHRDTCLDSDSSDFSWVETNDGGKIRNPDFPSNYIQNIKENIGKYEFILVSSHSQVRKALRDNCLFFYLVYPTYIMKELFLNRYKERGSSKDFIKLLSDNWEKWLAEIASETVGCKLCKSYNGFLGQEIKHILTSEMEIL